MCAASRADPVNSAREPSCCAELPHDPFSQGFVESSRPSEARQLELVSGNRRRRAPAARHFVRYQAITTSFWPRPSVSMDYGRLLDAHVDHDADITVAALPVTPEDATAMDCSSSMRRQVAVSKKSRRRASGGHRRSTQRGSPSTARPPADKPFIASMGIYVFSREVLLELLRTRRHDFGREISGRARVAPGAGVPARRVLGRCGTVECFTTPTFSSPNRMRLQFYDPRRPMYTHERFPAVAPASCTVRESFVADGAFRGVLHRTFGDRDTHPRQRGTRITARSCSARWVCGN